MTFDLQRSPSLSCVKMIKASCVVELIFQEPKKLSKIRTAPTLKCVKWDEVNEVHFNVMVATHL